MCGRTRAKGQSRNLLRVTLLAAAGVLLTCGSAGATSLSYTFDSDNQGWQQSQDGISYSAAGFQPTGGNPGGRLTAVDTGRETGCPGLTDCNLLYFLSPMVPHLARNYGGVASFDLRSSVNPGFAAELLLFPNGPNYLDGLIAESGGTTYHHLSITLAESSNWSVCPYAGGTCTPATQSGFRGLIASSDQIAVMADVGPNGTGETYDLDNVTLTEGPTPAAPPPHPGPQHKKKKNKNNNKKKKQQQPQKCKNKKRKQHATSAKKCKRDHAAGALLRG